jgi:hypothetical protein
MSGTPYSIIIRLTGKFVPGPVNPLLDMCCVVSMQTITRFRFPASLYSLVFVVSVDQSIIHLLLCYIL